MEQLRTRQTSRIPVTALVLAGNGTLSVAATAGAGVGGGCPSAGTTSATGDAPPESREDSHVADPFLMRSVK